MPTASPTSPASTTTANPAFHPDMALPQLPPSATPILSDLRTHELLLALSRPNYSLVTIAADFDLTLPQLSLLISNGEFADEFRACTDANTRFIRHAAAIQLHTVIRTLVATLEEVHYQLHSVPINHLNHHSLEARRFMMEVGRRSAVTLQQLTRLNVPTRITEAPAAITKARPAQPAFETPNAAPNSTQTRLSTGSMSMGSAFGLPEDSMFDDAFAESAFANNVGKTADAASPASSASGASGASPASGGSNASDALSVLNASGALSALSALGSLGVSPERTSSSPANSNHSPPPSPDANSDNDAGATSPLANLDGMKYTEPSTFKFARNTNTGPNANTIPPPPRPTPKSLRAAALANPATAAPSNRSPHAPTILDPAFQKQLSDALAIADAFLADLPPESHPPHS